MKVPRKIWKRFGIRRLSFKDYVLNYFFKIRYQYYRLFTSKLINWSDLDKKGMINTFEDDFDEISWGGNKNDKWIVGEHWGKFHKKKPNVYYGEPVLVENESHALFTVKHNPKLFIMNSGKILIPFEVSLLSTAKSFKQKYGRFECRMTLPVGKGVWPAFWMWGSTWPPEIDIIEAYGDNNGLDTKYQEINMHYGSDVQKNRSHIKPWMIKVDNNKTVGKTYHEFAVEWKPNIIEFYTNGVKIYQYTNKKVLDKWFNSEDANMWMIINNSLRDGFIKDDNTEFYSEFKVDYIRAYKFIK
jgi:hypothetical protein